MQESYEPAGVAICAKSPAGAELEENDRKTCLTDVIMSLLSEGGWDGWCNHQGRLPLPFAIFHRESEVEAF